MAPGAEGLIVLPYFSGERAPIYDDWARGVIFGLTLTHGRGHLYRALLEGVAYGLQHNLELIREAGIRPTRIVATGGGSRSHLWTQIMSDVTGLPQVVIAPSNAALGMAFLAGYASGIFSQISDVRRWARPEREVQPREEIHACVPEVLRGLPAALRADKGGDARPRSPQRRGAGGFATVGGPSPDDSGFMTHVRGLAPAGYLP